MQSVAQAWLVLKLTNSAMALGLVAFASYFPMIMVGLFAGAVVVPQDHIEPTRPAVIQLAEPAVAVPLRRIPFAILLPQQLQGEVAVGL